MKDEFETPGCCSDESNFKMALQNQRKANVSCYFTTFFFDIFSCLSKISPIVNIGILSLYFTVFCFFFFNVLLAISCVAVIDVDHVNLSLSLLFAFEKRKFTYTLHFV